MSFMGDVFRLSYAENSGGFLSLGAGLPEAIRLVLFIVLTILLLTVFLFLVLHKRKLNTVAAISSALVIGGGLGNILDRINNEGAVIDFMNIGIGPLRTGIFNVADMAIMAGAIMLLYLSVKTSDPVTDAAGLKNHRN